jgi:hypothetical protein
MLIIKTKSIYVFILCLLIAGCATAPIDPTKEWEKAQNINSFESYANFLQDNAPNNFTPEAKLKLKAIIREIALKSIDDNRVALKRGTEFSFNLFSPDDVLKSFVQKNLPVSYSVDYKSGQDPAVKHSEGFQELKDYDELKPLQSRLIQGQKAAAQSRVTVTAWMIPLTVSGISTIGPNTTFTFYRDPDQVNNRAFGISIKSELVKGMVEREQANIVGAGIVIIKSYDFVWVYDFSQDGKSLF